MNSSQLPSPQGGKDSKSPAEELFMQVFSLGDTPTTEEVKALAAKAGCDEDQVRTFFSKLRSSVRSFVQRAQRKSDLSSTGAGSSHTPKHATQQIGDREGEAGSGAAAGPPSPLAVIDRVGALRETGLRKLRLLLDESGGLRDSTVTGSFSQLMRKAEAATLRCDMLRALLATQRSTARGKLLQHTGFLPTLEDWAREGEDDHQATLLRLLLQVLGELPLTPALLKSSPGLVKAVGRLQKDRHPQVAAAAKQLSERWQAMTAQAVEASNAGAPAAAMPVARVVPGQAAVPSVAGTAAGSQQPGLGAAAAAPAVGPAAARGGSGGLTALRKPAAGEQLIQLGRKALFGKRTAATAAPLARAGSSAEAEAVASPRATTGAVAPGQPSSLRRLVSDGGSEGGATTPRGAAPLRTLGSGGPLRISRPMSVDDIRKAKERQKASEALQSLAGGPGPGHPPAKRPRPEAAESPRTAPLPPAFRQQQQPQLQAPQLQQPQAMQPSQQPQQPVLGAAPRMSPPAAAPAAVPMAAAGAIPGYAPMPSSAFGGMPPNEAAIAVQQYEQDKQRRAAARRAAVLQEYVAMDEAASRRGSMQSALPAYPPPPPLQLPQLDLPIAVGEESSEVVAQQARLALVPPAVYHSHASIPSTPEEPRSQADDPTWQVPLVPFVPIDPEEAVAQRERLLRDGVRLPLYLDLP